MKATEYFEKEYGHKHIFTVVEMKDWSSLYGLMDEFAEWKVKNCYIPDVLNFSIIKELKEKIIEAVQDSTDAVDGTVSIPILDHFLDEILNEQFNIANFERQSEQLKMENFKKKFINIAYAKFGVKANEGITFEQAFEIIDEIEQCNIANIVKRSEQLPCEHPEDKIWYNDKGNMQCNECSKEL